MYYFSLFTLSILSSLGVIVFFPDYNNSLFPLFVDIQTTLIFMPSYSILFYGVFAHLIKNKLRQNASLGNDLTIKFIIIGLYICTISAILLYVQDPFYSLRVRGLLVFYGIILGFIVTTVLDILFRISKNALRQAYHK